MIHDVTQHTILEDRESAAAAVGIVSGSMVIFILLVLIGLMLKNSKDLKTSKLEQQNANLQRKTFFDADESLIYLKDENLHYIFVNKAFENFFHLKAKQIVGLDDFALSEDAFASKRKQTDLAVLEKKKRIVDHVEWNGRVYRTTKFPVGLLSGTTGVGAYIKDVTEERSQAKKLEQVLFRYKILTDVLTSNFKDTQQQLDYVLHEALKLTESKYGYIYLYDEQKREFTLNSWTRGVMNDCDVIEKQTKYQLDKTGIWGEVVRQRKPLIVNDFEAPHPLKKGYPKGHVALKNFMSVPILIDGKIVAVVGLGNKEGDYTSHDIYETTMLMSGTWNAAERRTIQEELQFERNKYLQTLVSIGDGVMVVDKQGRTTRLKMPLLLMKSRSLRTMPF